MIFAEAAMEKNDFEKGRKRGDRRRKNHAKAVHKHYIDRARRGVGQMHDWYPNVHQYDKGKIHCSCPLCARKVNDLQHKRGAAKNWSIADLKKIDSMRDQERDYAANEKL